MLPDVPITALTICYGPLALTIIGFIVFAWITDVDARRKYLRQMDHRPEGEIPEVLPIEVTEPFDAETPSGAKVTIRPRPDA